MCSPLHKTLFELPSQRHGLHEKAHCVTVQNNIKTVKKYIVFICSVLQYSEIEMLVWYLGLRLTLG